MIAASLIALAFTFNGGNEVALARAVRAHFKVPVAVLVEPGVAWPKSTVAYTTEHNLPNFISGKLGLLAGNQNAFGFAPKHWPEGFFRKQNDHLYSDRVKVGKIEVISDSAGLLSSKNDLGLPIRVPQLLLQEPFRSVRCHWFFNTAVISVEFDRSKLQNVLEAVAGALGAKAEVKNGKPLLNLDPKQLRRRAIALLSKRDLSDSPRANERNADRSYYSELLAVATDEQIAKAYSVPGMIVEVPITYGTRLHSLALNRLQVLADRPNEQMGTAVRNLLVNVDQDGPVIARLSSDGHISAIYTGIQPHTQFVY